MCILYCLVDDMFRCLHDTRQVLLLTISKHDAWWPNLFSFLVDPPKILQHPSCQSAATGTQTTFTIQTTGDDLIFQWQKDASDVHNDSDCSGTDSNTLSIRHVKKSDEGRYRCLVMNEVKRDGEVSEEAKLTVCECPSDIVAVVVYYCNLCL